MDEKLRVLAVLIPDDVIFELMEGNHQFPFENMIDEVYLAGVACGAKWLRLHDCYDETLLMLPVKRDQEFWIGHERKVIQQLGEMELEFWPDKNEPKGPYGVWFEQDFDGHTRINPRRFVEYTLDDVRRAFDLDEGSERKNDAP